MSRFSPTPPRPRPDLASLVLRVTVGGLMLFHGVDKIMNGVGWMGGMLEGKGFPAAMAYGVYVGEIVAPILLILGVAMRSSALAIVFTMAMATYLLHAGDLLSVGDHGEYALELQVFYSFGAIAAALMGPGRYAVRTRGWLAKL